jgi:FtsP/CotA-like multicopper oxidase with cupredoxin domain
MDGVPPITQHQVAPGADFDYRFSTDVPGTYWFHPHVGLQQDRGLYGALIVEDPHEPLKYDDEWVVVLDDWLDGVRGATPDSVYAQLRKGMAGMNGMAPASATPSASSSMSGMSGMDGMGGMDGTDKGSGGSSASGFVLSGATSALLGGDAGDVKYPYYLVNGRVPAAPDVYSGKPGRRLRIRMINAGGDTAFRVALGGHRLTLTHTDGYPVDHEEVDALLIAPGERYDVLVTLGDGVFPLTALAEGKNAAARALVRTGSGSTPPADARPAELDGRILASTGLRAAGTDRLAARSADVVHRIELTGGMNSYEWTLNGRPFDMNHATAHPFTTRQGQRVRMEFVNRTTMWHPMHLHGHTFQLGADGPRKDTVIVLPGKTVACDLDAENPGRWLLHCHNVYHGEAGMMGLLGYVA